MNQEDAKPKEDNVAPKEESFLDLLRRCPIDEETWAIINNRPNGPSSPNRFDNIDDFDFGEDDENS